MVMKKVSNFVHVGQIHSVLVSPCLVSFPLVRTFPTMLCHELFFDNNFAIFLSHILARDTRDFTQGCTKIMKLEDS